MTVARLSNFINLLPPFVIDQQQMILWLAAVNKAYNSHVTDASKWISRFACKPERIRQRYTFTPDLVSEDYGALSALVTTSPEGSLAARMQFFAEQSAGAFTQLYENCTEPPHEIFHVTCTGYCAPSAAQLTVAGKGWGGQTRVSHYYHMGCYGALAAVRSGAKQLALGETIDVVHTELCSLHIDPLAMSAEQIVIQSLFGDGIIKYSLAANDCRQDNLQILASCEEIIPDSSQLMQWSLGVQSFNMVLRRDVPQRLKSAIRPFLKRLIEVEENECLHLNDLLGSAIFAIHPGGPLIIDGLAQCLELRDEQVKHSQDILFNYGNMSSATLPYIWQSLLADEQVEDGQIVVSLAFGPGLSIFGNLMRVCRP